MSFLDVLDATRICGRWSSELDDPAVWSRPVYVQPIPRPEPEPVPHTWRATVANPRAVLLTGLITAGVVLDAAQRVLPIRLGR